MSLGVEKGNNMVWRCLRWPVLSALLALVCVILSSGYTVVLTNKKGFCAGCHVMQPFVRSWAASSHGGNNRHGVVVQCVACHLPHDSLARFVWTKVEQGVDQIVSNLTIDPRMYDWAGNVRQNRTLFTYDSGCLECHGALFSPASARRDPGWRCRGRLVDRSEGCVACHPHVGHRDAIVVAEKFFHDVADTTPAGAGTAAGEKVRPGADGTE